MKKKQTAKQAFAQKLARLGVVQSNALHYKKQALVLAVGQERNRIIEREEMKKLRQNNLRERSIQKMLEEAGQVRLDKSPSKKKKRETDDGDSASDGSSAADEGENL